VILGSGRCGSTLLQSILNTNPEFLIWGEHNGFLRHVASAYFGALDSVSGFPDDLELDSAERIQRLRDQSRLTDWDNLFNREGFRRRFQMLLRSFFADPSGHSPRWGFKEIRYGRNRHDLLLPLVKECFPLARFIILVREPYATVFSMLSAWRYVERMSQSALDRLDIDKQIISLTRLWARSYAHLFRFLSAYPSESLLIRFEDLHNPITYESLSQFLETSTFDYASHLSIVKNAAIKSDETATYLRERITCLKPLIDRITRETRISFDYLEK